VAVVGRPAPRLELPGLEGGRVRLADLRGRPVVLNFWASWCPPCAAELPEFERVHRRLAGRVAFLGVNQRDQPGAAEALARASGVTYPLATDPAGRAFDAFGGLGMQATVLIRADGTVAGIIAGQLSDAPTDRRWDQVGGAVVGRLTRPRVSRPPGSDRGERWD
jgi:cytochrome c biogenesis protein CcmG/thiol:disulfide interchange protein DsbE